MKVETLMDDLANIQQKWKFARDLYYQQLAPDFQAIRLFDPKEIFLSRLIAFLLDPKGTHAQGDVFLQAFLKTLEHSWSNADTASAAVSTEAPDRLDIYVEAKTAEQPKRAIAIENKLFGAADQENQIQKYFNVLKKRRVREPLVVYLTRNGTAPSSESISDELLSARIEAGELKLMDARQLGGWLKTCVLENRAESVRHFIQALIGYVEHELMGIRDKQEEQQMTEYITDNPQRVGAFLTAIGLEREVKNALLHKFKTDLEYCLQDTGLALSKRSWIKLTSTQTGVWIYEESSGDTGIYAGFEFFNTQANGLNFGLFVKGAKEAQLRNDARRKNLNSLLGEGNLEDDWAWWVAAPHSTLPLVSKHWQYEPKPWVMIANNTLAPMFRKCALTLLQSARGIEPKSELT